jgi:hypothetical protein
MRLPAGPEPTLNALLGARREKVRVSKAQRIFGF